MWLEINFQNRADWRQVMENFKKLSEDEITARIERIGGQGWVTPTDYKRFSRQAVLIL